MPKQEVTPAQVALAAAAGVKLLQVEDLPVPLSIAKTGALGILESMLTALASGEVVLANPQAPDGDGEPAAIESDDETPDVPRIGAAED